MINMIILDGIKSENKKTSFITFSNENGKKIVVPVPEVIGNLISVYLRYLSTEPKQPVERGNEELSD